jgi:hypothetical protein
MGFIFSRRKSLGKGRTVNVSKSGVSASKKAGPVSINSRGTGRVRIAKGVSFKFKL